MYSLLPVFLSLYAARGRSANRRPRGRSKIAGASTGNHAMRIRKPPAGAHPPLRHADYRSTLERAPRQAPVLLPQGATELSGPRFDRSVLYPHHDDLTRQADGQPLGERIIVGGKVLDENGDPLPNTLVEIRSEER